MKLEESVRDSLIHQITHLVNTQVNVQFNKEVDVRKRHEKNEYFKLEIQEAVTEFINAIEYVGDQK